MAGQVQGMDGDHAAEEGSLGWIEYGFPEFGDRDDWNLPGSVQACNRCAAMRLRHSGKYSGWSRNASS